MIRRKALVVLFLLGSLGAVGVAGICAAGIACAADPSGGMADCGEAGPEWVKPCCCSGELAEDQGTLARSVTSPVSSWAVQLGLGVELASGSRGALNLDRREPPPPLDRQAVLCVYVI